jgi:hypothetical protein
MVWLLIISGCFVAGVLGLFIFGLLQPAHHSVTRSITLAQAPGTIFAVLDNVDQLPSWSSTIARVERVPDRNGRPTTRQTMKSGMAFIATTIERQPTFRLVGRLEREDALPLGTWTYELSPEGIRCRVAITEDGELNNPFFRAFARIRGLDASIVQQLNDLARRFGETATLR